MTDQPKYHLEQIFNPAAAHPQDAHSILMRLIPPNSKVLELGCASGYLSGYMEQALGCRVTGLEIDPAATAIAAKRCSEVYTVNLDAPNALDVAKASAPYNVLMAAAVLEHVTQPEAILQQAKKLLKSGGTVIVSLPNIAHWSLRLQLLLGRFNYVDYGVMDRTHYHFYTVKTARTLLEQQGFVVENIHIAGSGLQNLLNQMLAKAGKPLPPILPGLLGYELIFVARNP